MEWRERLQEAVANAGVGALAHGRSAALLRGVRVGPPSIEVWTPDSPLRLPGLAPDLVDGIPTVDAATMLLELCRYRNPKDVATSASALLVPLDLLSRRAESWLAARGPHPREVRALVDVLDQAARPDSELESRFLQMLDRAGLRSRCTLHLPIALPGSPPRTLEVDVAFAEHRLIVELDGWEYHRSKESFRNDRDRDVQLASMGWQVLRFTHRDIERRPAWVIEQLRRALSHRARPSSPS